MKHSMLLLAAGLLWSCCKVQAPQQSIEIIPPSGSPGDLVLVSRIKTGDPSKLEVHFGKTPAATDGLADTAGLRVMVPDLPPGKTTLFVLENGKELGSAGFEVIAPRATQLMLQIDREGKIATLSKKPYGGGFHSGFSHASRQLSYDILNESGQVLFSASIAYPGPARMEVHENPEGALNQSRESAAAAVVPLKIPNLDGAVRIRLYESGEGDLSQSAFRAKRRFLQEINIR